MQNEIWADVIGYEGLYQVSDKGRIKSLERYVHHPKGGKRLLKERIRKIVFDADGYCLVTLNKENKGVMFKIHRLVASCFIVNANNLPQVNHMDMDKTNNNASNLEWSSDRENNTHCAALSKNRASKFIGITRNARCKTWRAAITIKRKSIYLGSFKTEKEAGERYLKALAEYGIENKYAK